MQYLIVDAFADHAFGGNPAAVVWLDAADAIDDEVRARLASEFNLSETAFLSAADQPGTFDLRWFTPAIEVDLCGHATLAAAQALWHWGRAGRAEAVRFSTRSGILEARRAEAGVTITLPATPAAPCPPPADDLAAALGIEGPVACAGASATKYLLLVADEDRVLAARPDMRELARWPLTGVILSARSDRAGVDFVSRFFAPAGGVDEDPVTGSAHCVTGPYWAERLGRERLVAEQLSRRGGRIVVEVAGDRVDLTGGAVVVMGGEVMVSG